VRDWWCVSVERGWIIDTSFLLKLDTDLKSIQAIGPKILLKLYSETLSCPSHTETLPPTPSLSPPKIAVVAYVPAVARAPPAPPGRLALGDGLRPLAPPSPPTTCSMTPRLSTPKFGGPIRASCAGSLRMPLCHFLHGLTTSVWIQRP
jgi:hypothetical protein